ncbi:MAG: hypothetical protein EHM43_12945, partial [Ignavibacteriae bacterium]
MMVCQGCSSFTPEQMMTMDPKYHRTYPEIVAEVASATAMSDASALKALAEELHAVGTQEALAAAHRARGTACILTGADEEALKEYEKALGLYEVLGQRGELARVLGNMGNVYTSRGSFAEALEHFQHALAIYEDLGDRAGVGVVTGNMGNVFQLTGSYPSALEHFRRALEMHEELGNRYGVAIVTGNIGSVYSSTGSYAEALDHYRASRGLHEELCDLDGVAIVTCNMGNVYSLTKSYPEALEHFTQALKILEELGNPAGIALVTGNIITALLDRQEVQEAAELLERQTGMALVDPTVHALHFQNKARILEHSGDLVGARESLQRALQIAASAGVREGEAEIRRRLRDLAQLLNDFDGYVEHSSAYQKITEEIRGREATQRLAIMEAEHRMVDERREREKERAVLYSTLPKDIADRIVRGEQVTGDHYDQAAVIFLDIVDFTTIAESLPPNIVVQLLEQIFTALDDVCTKHDVVKIKTIGDSYMAVAFPRFARNDRSLPHKHGEDNVIPSEARDEVWGAANAAL